MGEFTDPDVLMVREAVAEVLRAGWVVRGCSDQEVNEFCSTVGVPRDQLPRDFEEFLLLAGRRCGKVAAGSIFGFPALYSLTDATTAFLEEGLRQAPGQEDQAADLDLMAGARAAMDRLGEARVLFGGGHFGWTWFAFLGHQGHSYLILRVVHEGRSEVYVVDESPPFLHTSDPSPSFAVWLANEAQGSTSRIRSPYEIDPDASE